MDIEDKDREEEYERIKRTHERLHRAFLGEQDERRGEKAKSLARTPDHLYKAITGAGFLEADIPNGKEERDEVALSDPLEDMRAGGER